MNRKFNMARSRSRFFENAAEKIAEHKLSVEKNRSLSAEVKKIKHQDFSPRFECLDQQLLAQKKTCEKIQKKLNQFLKNRKIMYEIDRDGFTQKRALTPAQAEEFYVAKLQKLADHYRKRDKLKEELELMQNEICTFTPSLSNNSRALMEQLPKSQRKRIEDRATEILQEKERKLKQIKQTQEKTKRRLSREKSNQSVSIAVNKSKSRASQANDSSHRLAD